MIVGKIGFQIMSNVLVPIYEQATIGKYTMFRQFTAAAMAAQAVQQRNAQWAAEQSVFAETFRPMYTFVEGMIYGITPLMAILIMLGPMGAGLVMKHLMGLAWVQMWMPLLSIANLYIYLAAAGKMAALDRVGGTPLPSLGSIYAADDLMSTWLAVGGYMAASAPALAAFLVTGSAVALTGVASRIEGSDHINEKMTAPDLSTTPAVQTLPSLWQHSEKQGTYKTHADQTMTGLNLSDALSKATSSEREAMMAATRSFGQTMSQAFSSAYSQASSVQEAFTIGNSIASGQSQLSQTLNKQANAFADKHGLTGQHRDEVVGAYALAATAGSGGASSLLNKLKIPAHLEWKGTTSGREIVAQSREHAVDFNDVTEAAQSQNHQAELRESLKSDLSNSRSDRWERQVGSHHTQALSKSLNQIEMAAERYRQMDQLQKQFAGQMNIDPLVASKMLTPYLPDLMAAVDRSGQQTQRASQRFNAYYHQNMGDGQQASTAAAISALSQTGQIDRVGEAVSRHFGVGDFGFDPQRNQDLPQAVGLDARSRAAETAYRGQGGRGSLAAGYDSAVARFNEQYGAPEIGAYDAASRAQSGQYGATEISAATVQSHHKDSNATVQQHAQDDMAAVGRQAMPKFRERIMSDEVGPGTGIKMNGAYERIANTISNLANLDLPPSQDDLIWGDYDYLQQRAQARESASDNRPRIISGAQSDDITPLLQSRPAPDSDQPAFTMPITHPAGGAAQAPNQASDSASATASAPLLISITQPHSKDTLSGPPRVTAFDANDAQVQGIQESLNQFYDYGVTHDLNPLEAQILAVSSTQGLFNYMPFSDHLNDERDRMRELYLDSFRDPQTGLVEDQAFRERVFEHLWDAPLAGEAHMDHYISHIGAYNRAEALTKP